MHRSCQRLSGWGLFCAIGIVIAGVFCPGNVVNGCPFCDAPTTTFSEQLASAHVAVLVRWQSAHKAEQTDFTEGTTVYETLAATGPAHKDFAVGRKITVNRYIAGRSEDECLLFASRQEDQLAWGLPMPVSPECWSYLRAAPAKDLPIQQRLPFFLAHLENPDPEIAMDAYSEFAGISYENLKELSGQFQRKKILHWLHDPLTIPTRKGLFGLMLGLCGTSEDAASLAELIRLHPEEARMGIDGMMAGYLLLTGNSGVKQLITWKLDDAESPDHEVYALLKSLEFLWSYARDQFDTDLLRTALRRMLPRPQLTGLVILDLARWQDWEMMDQLMAGYGQGPYADQHSRQCIIRFLMAATKDSGTGDHVPSHVQKARSHLDLLRDKDPAVVKYVERYPFD